MTDYQQQLTALATFDPNKVTVSYAVYLAGHKDLALYNKRGPANGALTRSWPNTLGILYENRNGTWTELAKTPLPECSFCGEMVPGTYSGVDYRNILISATPQYKSALICGTCRDNNLHRDAGAVDHIKFVKGL